VSSRRQGWKVRDAGVIVDNVSVLTVLLIVKYREYTLLDSPAARVVYRALLRSTNDLGPDATLEEASTYLERYSAEQMLGIANNVKGIAFEILMTDAENLDGDDTRAVLSEHTNTETVDAIYVDECSGEITSVQFKATADPGVAERFHEQHPAVEVIAADRDDLDWLSEQTQGTLDAIRNGSPDSSDYIDDYVPLGAALTAAPIVRDYWAGKITKNEAKIALVTSLGSRVGLTASKMFLLTTPAAPAVIGWSLFRIVQMLYRFQSRH
jgi:hypothetical protein